MVSSGQVANPPKSVGGGGSRGAPRTGGPSGSRQDGFGLDQLRCGGWGVPNREASVRCVPRWLSRWFVAGEVPSSGTVAVRLGGSLAELSGRGTSVGCATSLWWMSTSPWRAQRALIVAAVRMAWERYDGGLVVESSTFLHADLAHSCADE